MLPPNIVDLLNFADRDNQSAVLARFLQEGGTLQEVLRLSPEALEALYASAHKEFQKKNYIKARQLFALLTLFAPGVEKYWWGLGASHVALKEYRPALDAYAVLSLLAPHHSQPHFFAAFCRKQLGERSEATASFQRGVQLQKQWGSHE